MSLQTLKKTNVFLFGKKNIKLYFSNIAVDGIVTKIYFWKFIKLLFKNKRSQVYNEVLLIQSNKIINEEKYLAESVTVVNYLRDKAAAITVS